MLGHARANGSDQVVTLSPEGRSGVELRNSNLVMVAEGRIEEDIPELPAVGWEIRAESLSATLHLPPGYSLLATWGVDDESTSWIAQFDLLSILSLIVVCALGYWAEGLLGAVLCGLAGLSAGGLEFASMVVVGLLAGLRSVEKRIPSAQRLRQLGGAVGLLIAFGMVVGQIKLAALPNVPPNDQWNSYLPVHVDWESGDMVLNPDAGAGATAEDGRMGAGYGDLYGSSSSVNRKMAVSKDVYSNMSLQIDPNAVVQTGPGLPTWSGQTHRLGWSGPVEAQHVMRILLLSPTMALVWAIARAAAFIGFVLLASGAVREAWWRSGRPLFALLLLGSAWTGTEAHAEPGEAILKELKQKVEQGPACRPDCLEVSTLTFKVLAGPKGESLSIVAEVHAEESLSFALPGPVGAWVPNQVLVGDSPSASLSRREDGFLHVRVPKGVHRVTANGPLPESGGVTLQLGQSAQRVVLDAKGWQLAGVRADGTSDRNLQLVRSESSQAGGNQVASADNLHPWIVVRRFLDLGVPWRVRTRVERQGPASAPIALRVPILAGESVTVDGFNVEAGAVLVTLDQGREFVEWTGTLPSEDILRLQAPSGVPWTEEWALSCSPIFSCAIVEEGTSSVPAPFAHVHEGRWTPQWKPWPGEALAVAVGRPAATAGQTLTIDSATLVSTLRPRGSAHSLELVIRSAQGGQHRIGLPDGALLRSASVKGASVPVQARDGFVPIPLQPGLQQVVLNWEEANTVSILFAASDVDFGAPVANLTVRLDGLGERWVLGAKGPGWGPAVLLWPRLLLWGLASFLGFHVLKARRAWRVPVSGAVFVTLSLGLVVGSAPFLFITATLLLSLLRVGIDQKRFGPPMGLVAAPLLLLILGTVSAGLVVGLVGRPDVGIQGMLSSSEQLSWYLQGAPPSAPRPVVATLPMLNLRVLILAWGLLLLWASLRVFPFCYTLVMEGLRHPPQTEGPKGGPPSTPPGHSPVPGPTAAVADQTVHPTQALSGVAASSGTGPRRMPQALDDHAADSGEATDLRSEIAGAGLRSGPTLDRLGTKVAENRPSVEPPTTMDAPSRLGGEPAYLPSDEGFPGARTVGDPPSTPEEADPLATSLQTDAPFPSRLVPNRSNPPPTLTPTLTGKLDQRSGRDFDRPSATASFSAVGPSAPLPEASEHNKRSPSPPSATYRGQGEVRRVGVPPEESKPPFVDRPGSPAEQPSSTKSVPAQGDVLVSVVDDPATERSNRLPPAAHSLLLLSETTPGNGLIPPVLPASLLSAEPEPEDDFPTAPPESVTVAVADVNHPLVLTPTPFDPDPSEPLAHSEDSDELELARLLGGEPQAVE
jgi:hypothetical protein